MKKIRDFRALGRMLGLDLDSWNAAMLISLGVAALAAVAGVVSTTAVVKLQKQEAIASERALERYKTEAAEKISAADARAAEAQRDTAASVLEQEKLKAQLAWRTIQREAAMTLEAALAAKPGSVNLRWTDGDPEALFLAIQISKILNAARWRIAPGAIKPTNSILFGISLPDSGKADAEALRDAFMAARIAFSGDRPEIGVAFSIATIEGAPTLMVGSKTPMLP